MKQHLANWSKLWLSIIFVFGFAGYVLILYGWLVVNRPDAHYMLLANTGLMSTCFGFYEWKARHENAEKIRNNPAYSQEEASAEPSSTCSNEAIEETAAEITKKIQDEVSTSQVIL